MLIIATDVNTKLWCSIVKDLKEKNWSLFDQYTSFDKGIDFDYYTFLNHKEWVHFAWSPSSKGELRCTRKRMRQFEKSFKTRFSYGKPTFLHKGIINKIEISYNREDDSW